MKSFLVEKFIKKAEIVGANPDSFKSLHSYVSDKEFGAFSWQFLSKDRETVYGSTIPLSILMKPSVRLRTIESFVEGEEKEELIKKHNLSLSSPELIKVLVEFEID
jgi:hypothetical protein